MYIQCIIPCTIHTMLILHPILLSNIGLDGHPVYNPMYHTHHADPPSYPIVQYRLGWTSMQCIIPCTIHAMLILTVHPILLSHIGWDGHPVYNPVYHTCHTVHPILLYHIGWDGHPVYNPVYHTHHADPPSYPIVPHRMGWTSSV